MTNFITRTAERRFKIDDAIDAYPEVLKGIAAQAEEGYYHAAFKYSPLNMMACTALTKAGFSIDFRDPHEGPELVVTWHLALPGTFAHKFALRKSIAKEQLYRFNFKPNEVDRRIREALKANDRFVTVKQCPVYLKLELMQKGYIFQNIHDCVFTPKDSLDPYSKHSTIVIFLCTKLTTQPSASPVASEPQTEM